MSNKLWVAVVTPTVGIRSYTLATHFLFEPITEDEYQKMLGNGYILIGIREVKGKNPATKRTLASFSSYCAEDSVEGKRAKKVIELIGSEIADLVAKSPLPSKGKQGFGKRKPKYVRGSKK